MIDMADAKKGQLAWRGMGVEGSQHAGQAREARQEHQRRGEEDLQELSAEAEDVATASRQPEVLDVVRRSMAALVRAGARQRWRRSAQSAAGRASSRRKTLNLSAYAELLRSDVRAQKVAIITEVMGFTEAEDAAFWPIYREYDLEMAKLGDERVALIEEYACAIRQMTDAMPQTLAGQGARPRGSATGRSRPSAYERVQEGAVAADRSALPAGRAPAAAADRSADLGRRFRVVQVKGQTLMMTTRYLWMTAACSSWRPACPLSADRVQLRSGKIDRGHVHRRRQQVGPRAARQRAGVRDPDRRRHRGRVLGAQASDATAAKARSQAGRRARASSGGGARPRAVTVPAGTTVNVRLTQGDRRRHFAGRHDLQGEWSTIR